MIPFMNEDQVKANITIPQMLRSLWPYARRHPYLLAISTLSVLGVAISSRFMPFLIGYAIDQGIEKKNMQVLKLAALGFLIAEITHVIFLFGYQYLFQKFGNRMLFYIREDLLRHTQHLPMSFFNKTPVGRIVTRLTNDTSTLGEVFTDGIINIFTESAILISIVVSMFLISWKLALATLILSPFFIWGAFQITEKIRVILRDSKKQLSLMNSFATESLSGIRVVQLFNRVDRSRKHFNGLSGAYRSTLLKSIRHYALMQPVMNVFNAVTITTALYYGGVLANLHAIAIGALVAFLMHVQDFISPLREILDKYQEFQNSLTSAERVFQLLEEPEEFDCAGIVAQPLVAEQRGAVEFRNLSFRYEPSLPLVLKDIQLNIKPGSSVALIGRTGSGKTSLVSLLQRFYIPPAETIFLDGVAIEKIAKQTLHTKIGVVQQDNFIFRGSIRDNVSLGDPSISETRILYALEQVGFDRFLKRSGRNLDSKVEEKGANLSVGERQLISFARILAFQPEILVLDEATSNVDSETERLIQEATRKVIAGRTSLIIAHRLSTIRDCDQIVVLKEGEIQEVGSHQDLMQKGGLYAQLALAGVKFTDTVL
jgi:ATP-binding cassette subfamily B multidrug efflux pump